MTEFRQAHEWQPKLLLSTLKPCHFEEIRPRY